MTVVDEARRFEKKRPLRKIDIMNSFQDVEYIRNLNFE